MPLPRCPPKRGPDPGRRLDRIERTLRESGRPPRTPTPLPVLLFPVLLAGLAASFGCGGSDGRPATPTTPPLPTGPPPLRPLAWRTAPGKLTIPVGESRSFTATLTAAVDAEYTVATADAKVAVSSEVLGPGVFRGTLVGLAPGESEVTLTAEAAGYAEATAMIGVVVERPPPLEISGAVQDTARNLLLVGSTVRLTDLDGGDPPRSQETSLTGYRFEDLRGDRYRLEAFHPGYESASRVVNRSDPGAPDFEVIFDLEKTGVVTDYRFNRRFWDQIAFDAYECPDEGSCPDYYTDGSASAALEERVLFVLPFASPSFHIRTHNDDGERRLSSAKAGAIRREIAGAVEQLTGEAFRGEITSGSHDVRRDGWITIRASSEEDDPDFWEADDAEHFVCGTARVGALRGSIWLNSDRITTVPLRNKCLLAPLVIHEIGHSMGFFHVSGSRDVMATLLDDSLDSFTSREQYHAQLAYELGRYTPYTDGPLSALMTMAARKRDGGSSRKRPVIRCFGR